MASAFAASSDSPLAFADAENEVSRWRLEQFRQLGLSGVQATELAASEADLGQARYLLGSGCAPELALQILL